MATPPLIVYLAPPGDDQRGQTFLQQLTQAWPQHATPPRTHTITPEQFSDALSSRSKNSQLPPPTSWSATLLDPNLPANDIRVAQAIDRLDELHIPAVELSEPTNATPKNHYASAIQLPVRVPPIEAAWALYALCARQQSVRLIASALRLVQSSQGEAADTLDRMNEELLIAAKVQRDFLPDKLPISDRLDAAVLFRPAGVVSGDIYDAVRSTIVSPRSSWPTPWARRAAALMTLFMTRSVPTRAGDANADPAASLAALNSEMAASRGGPTRFSTAVCGVIDTHRTGHHRERRPPPIIVIGPTGVRYIEASGLLLASSPTPNTNASSSRSNKAETMLVHPTASTTPANTPNPTRPAAHQATQDSHTSIHSSNPTSSHASRRHRPNRTTPRLHVRLTQPLDDITVMAFSLNATPAPAAARLPHRYPKTTPKRGRRMIRPKKCVLGGRVWFRLSYEIEAVATRCVGLYTYAPCPPWPHSSRPSSGGLSAGKNPIKRA